MSSKYPFFESEIILLDSYLETEPDPVEWVECNISIPEGSAYGKYGPVQLSEFQKFLLRLLVRQDVLLVCIMASVQVGKSFIVEMALLYIMRFRTSKVMFCYATTALCKRVIKERLTPLISKNSELSKLLTGIQDDVAQFAISLKNGTLRLGSAEAAENTICSFSSQIVVGSECSKYPENIDVIKMLDGRYTYFIKTQNYKAIYESSPKYSKDNFSLKCASTELQLYPFCKLPCGHYAYLEDKIIKVIHDESDEPIQDVLILGEQLDNAWIECPECGCRVFEKDHFRILQTVIWCDASENIENDTQEEFLDIHSFTPHINRLYDEGYTFVQCMIDFFTAKNKIDGGTSLRIYQNETQGRPVLSVEDEQLEQQEQFIPRKIPYYIYSGSENRHPLPVKFALLGGDTQQFKFYFVIRGFTGLNSDTYLLDADTIEFDKLGEDKEKIYKKYYERTFGRLLKRTDGTTIPLLGGMQDQGGNNGPLVDHIVSKIPELYAYKGSSEAEKAVLIKKSETNNKLYLGNTASLSKIVHDLMYNRNFYLPEDVSKDYLKQLQGNFWRKIQGKGADDNYKMKFEHTANDHYRSSENYCQAAATELLWDAFNPKSPRVTRDIDKFTGKVTIADSHKALANAFSGAFNNF